MQNDFFDESQVTGIHHPEGNAFDESQVTGIHHPERHGAEERRRRIRESFATDPLAWATEEERMRLTPLIERSQNPEETKKRLALAAFYAKGDRDRMTYLYRHLDRTMEIADDGKRKSVDQAYAEVQKMFQEEQNGDKSAWNNFVQWGKDMQRQSWTFAKDTFLGELAKLDNLRIGFYQYTFNMAVGLHHLLASDKRMDDAADQHAASRYEKLTEEIDAQKIKAFYDIFGIDGDPYSMTPRLDRTRAGAGAPWEFLTNPMSLRKPNSLGITPPPPLLAFRDPKLNDPEQQEQMNSYNREFMDLIRNHPDEFQYAKDAKTPFQVWEAYRQAVIDRSDPQSIAKYHKRLDELDKEHERRRIPIDAEKEAAGAAGRRERIERMKSNLEQDFRENQVKYHPGELDKDTLMSLTKRGDFPRVISKGFAICYDQIAQSILPMAATAWATGGASGAGGAVEGMGSLGQLGLTVAGKTAQTATFATAMYGEGHQEAIERNLVGEEADDYAFWHAVYEVVPEYCFGWFKIFPKIAVGKGRAGAGFWGTVRSMGGEFVKSGAEDTFGEFITFIAEKYHDAANGYNTPGGKKLGEMSGKEFREFFWDGFVEMLVGSFFTAGGGGAIAGARGKRSFMEQQRIAERAEQYVESRIHELAAKENLTDAERQELNNLQTVKDSGDFGQAVAAAQKIVTADVIHTMRKQNAADMRAGEAAAGVSEETARNGDRAAEAEKLKRELPHDPEETRQAVEEAAQSVRAEVGVTEEWTKEELQPQIERMRKLHPELTEDECFEFLRGRIGALWKDGKIVVNINNVRPSEVPFKIRHEALLHDGIRRAFGDEAANQLLDFVWDERGDSDAMRAILERYQMIRQKTDENGNYVFDEDGIAVYQELSQEDKRLAAEEFLAHLQETNGVPTGEIYADHKVEIDDFAREHGMDIHDRSARNIDRMTREWMAATGFRPPRPSWLKQLISRIRMWLHQHGFFVQHLTDDDILTILARSAKAEVAQRRGKSAQGDGVRFAIGQPPQGNPRPYYQVPFADGLKRVVDPAQKSNRDPIFVCNTPEVFRQIGFTALPMMANVRHTRLNYYTETEFKNIYGRIRNDEHAHGLHDALIHLPQALEHPLAVVINTAPNAKQGSVVAITDMNVNGKKIVVPVLIEATSSADNQYINSHLVLTVYDEKDWIGKFLAPALQAEKKGVGVFYFDKVKAARYNARSKVTGIIPTGIIHNINDPKSPVKGVFKKQTETLQFQRWFKKSKVVDANGEPLVVYHGTNWDMLSEAPGEAAFSDRERGTGSGDNGFFGRGFYFTFGNGQASKGEAHFYGRNVYSFYLSIQNPFYFNETLREWNGARLYGDEVSSIEIINAVKLFPELLKDYTLNTYDGRGEYTGEISLPEYAALFERIYREKKFLTRKSGGDADEVVLYCDPVKRSENGHTWTEYRFERRFIDLPKDVDIQLLGTHLYLQDDMHVDQRKIKVDVPYNLLRDFYGEPEFRAWLEKQGYDGVIQSKNGDEVVAFFPEQIKSATDNVGTFDPNNPDVRYSIDEDGAGFVEPVPFVSGIDDSRGKNIVAMLRPIVGRNQANFDKEALARNLKERYGVDVSPVEALLWAREAARQNYVEEMRRQRKVRDQWLYENNLLWKQAVDYAGSENFKVRVSERMNDRELSGPFWPKPGDEKKYSGKIVDLDALANEVARQQSRDALDVEQEFFDFFNGLDKPKLHHQYTEFRQQELAGDREAARQAKEEWMRQEKFRIEDEVVRLIEAGQPVTEEWAKENRKAYEELYRRMFDGKEAPRNVGKADLEAINAALVQAGGDAASFAEAYKAAREKAYSDFNAKLRELRDKVMQSKADAVKLQREALDFAEKNLPPEFRGEFARRIVGLLEYSTETNGKYPEGRRMHEFRKLLEDMTARSNDARRRQALDQIAKRLGQLGEKAREGRKVRGVRDIETQQKLNRIIEISRMDGGALNMEITERQHEIEKRLADGASTVDLEYDIALLDRYGELWNKSADDVQTVLDHLNDLARQGRDNLLREIQERQAEDERDRNELWQAVNGMKRLDAVQKKAVDDKAKRRAKLLKKADAEFWSSLSLDGIFRACADFCDGDSTILDRLARWAHRARVDKDTLNLHNADGVREKLNELFHVKTAIGRAEALGKWRKLTEHSGVFRFVPDPDAKQFKYTNVSVAEARKMLADYDAGRGVLADYEAEAIRQQLRTLDLGVKYDDVPEEFRDGATEKLLKLIRDEEGAQGNGEVQIVIPRQTFNGASREVPLTQLQGLYLKLMWDQKDVRYKMHFNGWTEESIRQLDKFLTPEVKEFGEWMRGELEKDRGRIGEVYQKMYYAMFPAEEMYFPSVFDVTKSGKVTGAVDIAEEGAGAGAHTYTPGALKVRVYHLKDIRVADALTVFQNHRLLMNHFVTHAEAARKMRAVLLNSEIKKAITAEHGAEAYSEMQRALTDFINGGNADVAVNGLAAELYANSVRAKMAFNIFSGAKQALGGLTYLQEMPAGKLASGIAYAMAHPKEVYETLGRTDYFRARLESGANADLRLLLDAAGKKNSGFAAVVEGVDRAGSFALRYGDAAAVLFGGYAVYKYHFDNLVKRGVPEADARREALTRWEMATERTQQSSNPFFLNRHQRGGYMERMFTTFLSNQILLWNNNAASLYKAIHYKNYAALKKAGYGTAALVLSSLAATAVDQLRLHAKDDEYEWADLFWNLIADMVCGAGPAGSLAAETINTLKPGGHVSPKLVIGDVLYAGYSIKRQFFGSKKAALSDNDWKDAVNILVALGYLWQPIAEGAAVAKESRKWYQVFNGRRKR